jgi:hypothetical protein
LALKIKKDEYESFRNVGISYRKVGRDDMVQYFSDRLRDYVSNSVYCLYSGGEIYVIVYHKVFDQFCDRFKNDPKYSWDKMAKVLGDALDYLRG